MRINLVKSSEDNKENYQNIPISTEGIQNIPDSVCMEMSLDHVIDHMTDDDFLIVLKKIRHNGVIEIRGVDAPEVFRKVSIGLLGFANSLPLLSGKVRLTSSGSVRSILEGLGFITEVNALQDSFYYIKAKRP